MKTPTLEEQVEELYREHHTFSHENGDRPCLAFYKKNKRTGAEKYMDYSKNYPDDSRCDCGAVATRTYVKEEYRKALLKAEKRGVEKVTEFIAKKREHRLMPIQDPKLSPQRASNAGYELALTELEEAITNITKEDEAQ